MVLSKRAQSIGPSPTLGLTARAKAMKAEGIDVIGFGAGEPDFDTPMHIKEEAKRALDEGFTKYTPTSGIPELKQAICKKFKEDNGLDYEPSQVIVSCGAKHCIYNAVQVLCEEGDEVILPAPYWVSFPEQIRLAGAKPVIIGTKEEDRFKLPPPILSKYITNRTKLLILNSPCNPTGTAYSKEELQKIAEILVAEGIWVISDEIYEKIVYDGFQQVSIASLNPKIKDLTIVVNGVSKTYSMTGWRIGYAAGDKQVIGAMSNLQDHSTSNPTSFAQKAAVVALSGTQEPVTQMVIEFKKRRDYIIERLNQIPGITCLLPQGAFYAFPNISKVLGRVCDGQVIENSTLLAEMLLTQAKVAVVPGSAFGADNYLRLSYATSMDNIAEGSKRIKEWIKKI
ncbi:MAG: pyridoxal phosphate-dependent aminotransferase [Dehalococcoidia bacterium]|nr:pyridoxal phosphate-dependent aminotransferase [Dehalococcoidia bacterium]